jgi:hypothetical protein
MIQTYGGGFEIMESIGDYKLDILHLPKSTIKEAFSQWLISMGIQFRGINRKDCVTTTIFQIGFDDEEQRGRACFTLHGIHCPMKRQGATQVSINWNPPRTACYRCFHPDYPKLAMGHGAKECTAQTCDVCHSNDHSTINCGFTKKRFRPSHRNDQKPDASIHGSVHGEDSKQRAGTPNAGLTSGFTSLGVNPYLPPPSNLRRDMDEELWRRGAASAAVEEKEVWAPRRRGKMIFGSGKPMPDFFNR